MWSKEIFVDYSNNTITHTNKNNIQNLVQQLLNNSTNYVTCNSCQGINP